MSAKALAMWPIEHLRIFAVAAVTCALSVAVNAVWPPSIDPISPAELSGEESEELTSIAQAAQANLDFIFRPLFRPSRRPHEQKEETPSVTVQQATGAASMQTLAGYSLLGVFASGETNGAIVASEEGQRQRLFVGDQLDGWRLQRTSLRAAYFENSAGALASIELALASSLPVLPTVAAPPSSAPPTSATSDEGELVGSRETSVAATARRPQRPPGPVTFESIGARKRAEQEAARKKSK